MKRAQRRLLGAKTWNAYGRAFLGCDPREAETLLFGTDSLLQQTHVLPEIFHCIKVPADSLDEAYCLIDYDPKHLSSWTTYANSNCLLNIKSELKDCLCE